MSEDTEGLAREAAAIRAAGRAMDPYVKELADIKGEVRATKEELRSIREDALRLARYADEDRKRLASSVKEDAETHATEVAEKVINQMMRALGLDPDKPADFVRDMQFLKELRETFGAVKRHALMVLIGVIMLGLATGAWQALKAGAKP